MTTFCPATMCPLFAQEGSPWTEEKNAPCSRGDCAWFHGGCCMGAAAAAGQVQEAAGGARPLQLGPQRTRFSDATPRTYDCPRAHECQWQREAGDGLCPPRLALALGVDPRAAAY